MDKGSLIRTVLLAIALINQLLVAFGISPLPLGDDILELFISTTYTVVIALITWWKNNYISKRGQAQKKVLQDNGLTTAK